MLAPVSDRLQMLQQMDPALVDGRFAFVTVADAADPRTDEALGQFREDEGLSLIVAADAAPGSQAMRQITLRVHSSLEGVGLTAAVSGALARAGIPANIVAAFHHDHLFVPEAQAEAALAVLIALSADARSP